MHRRRVGVAVVVAIVALVSWFGSPAQAACHFFFFSDGTTSDGQDGDKVTFNVTEGNKVELIIERDAAVADSSVQVTTVNKTAKAPGDFTEFDERVEFTGNQTEKKITIQTREDVVDENSESFEVKLHDAEGCDPPNPNYRYGEPAAVTIRDDDQAIVTPKPTPKPTAKPAPARTTDPRDSAEPSPTASESPTPKPTKSPESTPSGTPTLRPLAVDVEEDSGFPWLPVLAVGGFLAAAGGALMLVRLRGGGL